MPPSAKPTQGQSRPASHLLAGLAHLRRLWNRLGLTSQFLLVITLVLLTLSQVSSMIQADIAMRTMVQSSLDVEQALARGLLQPAVGERPVSVHDAAEVVARVDEAVRNRLDPRYINKVKLWSVEGQLIYSSSGDIQPGHWKVPEVERALNGETVILQMQQTGSDNDLDGHIGPTVYEVYMPLYAADGTLVAVGEIYCSVDLLVSRMNDMLGEVDRVRLGVMVGGLLLLGALVFFAHRTIEAQRRQLDISLAAAEGLSQRNSLLLRESEVLRRNSAEANERLLNHIGAELHDGPIQLLSIAALYRSQVPVDTGYRDLNDKAAALMDSSLKELRNISAGLLLPDLKDGSLQGTVSSAVAAFAADTGLRVDLDLDRQVTAIPLATRVTLYRIVTEALNNARKHGLADGIRVSVDRTGTMMEIKVRNLRREPCGRGAPASPTDGLGLIGMEKRARAIGASLDFRCEGHSVELALRLHANGTPIAPGDSETT
ncbi:sensor histidine kinase [Gemmobacter nectariphilus]|uniref:sensor histidine kinase n=1 Tax=Gemmobacter nectariphilus TaxID=220343 RepID=UPI00048520D3|nr:hypothetical protein [Gemmobacter nectariphilus]